MLYGLAKDIAKLRMDRPPLERAIRFLTEEVALLPDGRHDLDDGVYVNVTRYSPGKPETRRFESHVEYADVQCVVEGGEIMHVAPASGLEVVEDRLAEKDMRYHADPPAGRSLPFSLLPGYVLILLPEDAHKGGYPCGFDEVRKALAKIPMKLLLNAE